MKPLGPASDGKSWVIRKSAQSIPFVTDGVKSRWCMTVFQDHAPKNASIEEAAELPSLEVTDTILAESKGVSKNSNDSTRAELPGVSPQVGTWFGFIIMFYWCPQLFTILWQQQLILLVWD